MHKMFWRRHDENRVRIWWPDWAWDQFEIIDNGHFVEMQRIMAGLVNFVEAEEDE